MKLSLKDLLYKKDASLDTAGLSALCSEVELVKNWFHSKNAKDLGWNEADERHFRFLTRGLDESIHELQKRIGSDEYTGTQKYEYTKQIEAIENAKETGYERFKPYKPAVIEPAERFFMAAVLYIDNRVMASRAHSGGFNTEANQIHGAQLEERLAAAYDDLQGHLHARIPDLKQPISALKENVEAVMKLVHSDHFMTLQDAGGNIEGYVRNVPPPSEAWEAGAHSTSWAEKHKNKGENKRGDGFSLQ